MMLRGLLILIVVWVAIVVIFGLFIRVVEGGEPPRATQPHTDTFTGSYGNLQDFNPVTAKAKATRLITYTLTVRPGCSAGVVSDALTKVEADAFGKLDEFRLVRVASNADIDVIVACGTEQVNRCGSANTYCVQGKPYYGEFSKPTVFISDVISLYPEDSRLSVLLHEIIGHAIATWNEQYCVGYETSGACQGQAQFTSTPNHPDFMNTGPLSRHTISSLERERWDRTMYPLIGISLATPGSDWCCDTVYGGWEGLGVARFNTPLASWYWGIPQANGVEFLFRWRNSSEGWACVSGCPR